MGTSRPTVSKNANYPCQVSVVCWIDLLGYGRMISTAGFSPLHPLAGKAFQRLRRFHEVVAENSARNFPTLVMNDGAVAYRDLSFRTRSNTHDFLNRAWTLFRKIQETEEKDGYPGARLVLASGFRMRGRRAGIDARTGQFKSLIDRFGRGAISAEQAIREAAMIQPKFDIIPHLQANFAFTKAYVAETSGTAGGLPGPAFYVDMALFNGRPNWIKLGPDIDWKDDRLGLSATFARIMELPVLNEERGPLDIRDGLQVAQHLEQDPNVLQSLRASVKP